MGFFDALGLSMLNDYESRKVYRYETEDLIVDTCYANDTETYETAISHSLYNDGYWIVVEEYDTLEEAQEAHHHWVQIMTNDVLPTQLKDVSSCVWKKMLDDLGENSAYGKQGD